MLPNAPKNGAFHVLPKSIAPKKLTFRKAK
jgi:hypothetical protein